MRCGIIYEDKDVIVICKPAGLATQTARVGQPDAVSELKNYLAGKAAGGSTAAGKTTVGRSAASGKPRSVYLGVVHRLDQPVEGLLVFAKNKKAAAALTAQLGGEESGTLNKQYRAVVCGKPGQQEATLVDKLYRTEEQRAVVVQPEDTARWQAAKKAVLHYRVLSAVRQPSGEWASLLSVTIETGRFHQIRAQLSHAGFPILGDAKYASGESAELSASLGVKNVALCACELSFRQPVSGKQLSFTVQPQASVFSIFGGK